MATIIPVRVSPDAKAHVVRSGDVIPLGHPLYDGDCPVCGHALPTWPVSLVYVGREPGEGQTAAAVAVHDICTDTPARRRLEEIAQP